MYTVRIYIYTCMYVCMHTCMCICILLAINIAPFKNVTEERKHHLLTDLIETVVGNLYSTTTSKCTRGAFSALALVTLNIPLRRGNSQIAKHSQLNLFNCGNKYPTRVDIHV